MAVGPALFRQDGGQPLQGLPGVDHAGGVVGGVDHHALGVLGDGGLKGVKVDLESLDLRGNEHHLGPSALDKDLILREVGSKDDELVPGAGQAVEHTAQGGGGPHGDVELVGGIAGAEAAVEGVGEALAGLLVPLGAGVAVDDLRLLPKDADGGVVDLLGAGDAGVAQGEVEDILRPHLGGTYLAVFKELADDGPGGAQPQHALIHHEDGLLSFV